MKISNVDAFILRIPEIRDDVDGTQDTLLVRVETDEGVTGWGEVDSSPYVAKAVIDAGSSHGISQGLRSVLLGMDPLCVEQAWRTMYEKTRYHGRFGPVIHAMSGVDMALWDICGKVRGEPIYRMLGACYRQQVTAYASALMPDTPAEACQLAARFRRQGFSAMKFGWGPIGSDPERDRELFQAVRAGAGADAAIMVDAGQCYGFREALRAAETLAGLDAGWLEEPLDPDDLAGYARLSAASPIPIAAGEAESGYPAFERLLERGMVDIVQPDLSRAGGFTEARRIAALAETRGRRCIPHAFKSNMLLAATLHFCAATKSASLVEYSMSETPIRLKLTTNGFPMENGCVRVPDGPGLGIEVDCNVVSELAREAESQARVVGP